MKKFLSTVTLLGALAGAASAEPYTLPSPAGGALTPYDWQPVYSIDGLYSIANQSEDPNLAGFRLGFNLINNAESSIRHQFNVNIGYLAGSETYNVALNRYKLDVEMIPFTVGYDLNIGLSDSVFLYLGAKAGYSWADVSVKGNGVKGSSSDGGFTFSVGGGIKVQCSDSIYVKAGYEFGRTYLNRGDDNDAYGAHTITVGVGVTF